MVQEVGRAGRNGSQAEAILYHKASGHKLMKQRVMEKIELLATDHFFSRTFYFMMCKQILLHADVVIYVLYYVHAKIAIYSTALVQCREYVCATRVVVACGPHMYSHDIQFASNLQVVYSNYACNDVTSTIQHS